MSDNYSSAIVIIKVVQKAMKHSSYGIRIGREGVDLDLLPRGWPYVGPTRPVVRGNPVVPVGIKSH